MLSDADIEKLSEAIAAKQQRFLSPVLNVDEAMQLVGKRSSSGFGRWREKWRVPACSDGRYSRRELDAGMKREARNRCPSRKPQTVSPKR